MVGGSLVTPASSTTKTGRHDIAEILLKVALNTKKFNIFTIYIYFKNNKSVVKNEMVTHTHHTYDIYKKQ
jgi:hypothetical protein